MNRKCFIKYIFIFLILSSSFSIFAQESSKYTQRLEWTDAKNAGEYKVEVRSVRTGKITTFSTENTYIEFSMSAGKYEYRVHVYDYLGRQSSVTEWKAFEISKVTKPEIASSPERIESQKEGEDLQIPVSIKSVTKNSQVALVNQETGESVEGKLVLADENASRYSNASNAVFPAGSIENGKWKLRITNPGGLFTESDELNIGPEEPVVSEPVEIAESEPEVSEPVEIPEPVPEIPEPVEIAESEPEVPEPAEITEPVPETPEPAEIAEELPSEKEPEVSEPSEPEPEPEVEEPEEPKEPYKVKGFYALAGAGYSGFTPLFDSVLCTYSQVVPVSANVMLGFVPVSEKKIHFGGELSASLDMRYLSNDYLRITMPYLDTDLSFVFRYDFIKDLLSLDVKAGAGLTFLFSKIDVLSDSEGTMEVDGYINGLLGLAVVWTPLKYLQAEVGINCNADFIVSMPTFVVNPYVAIGVRF